MMRMYDCVSVLCLLLFGSLLGCLLGGFLLFSSAAIAQTATQTAAETTDVAADERAAQMPLRVITKEIMPLVFVDREDDRATGKFMLRGFSIDLWGEVATRAALDFEYILTDTVMAQLDAVAQGEADMAIAAISITSEREERIDFSHPYLKSGLQILTTGDQRLGIGRLLSAFLSPALLEIIGIFFLLLLVAAHLIWLVERRRNPEFPRDYLRGIWEAIWWAAVTVTTVGYGDKTPRGVAGRAFGLMWMFLGLFLVANFTAGITAVLTAQQLKDSVNSIADLQNGRVATVVGTTADEYLTTLRVRHVRVDLIDDAYELLANGQVQAVVYDAPVLLYYANTRNDSTLQVVGDVFNEEEYGIALAENSPYREPINRALLEIREDGTYDILYQRWFGE